MKTATKKLRYSKDLGEQFIDWNAAQNLKEQGLVSEEGKINFTDWRNEISKIKSCLMFSKNKLQAICVKRVSQQME